METDGCSRRRPPGTARASQSSSWCERPVTTRRTSKARFVAAAENEKLNNKIRRGDVALVVHRTLTRSRTSRYALGLAAERKASARGAAGATTAAAGRSQARPLAMEIHDTASTASVKSPSRSR